MTETQPPSRRLGYARVSTYGQTLDAQLEQLKAEGCAKVYREKASGARADRRELLRMLKDIRTGDVVTVTRIDRLARSTFDLFAIVKQIVDAGGQFRSLAEPWADTGTSTGRLMIAVLGGLADVERDLIRTRTSEGRSRAKDRGQHMGRPPSLPATAGRGTSAPGRRCHAQGTGEELQCRLCYDFSTIKNGAMTTRQTDATVAPALKALGGWADAPWFSPSILSDSEVVGFQFPPLPSVRKQSFEITDRSASEKPSPRKAIAAQAKTPKRIAGKLSNLLDTFGVTRAVACGRSRFLFEASPTLFFTEMPVTKLKATAANKLRRGLIENGLGGCVVNADGHSVMLMFWPAGDEPITEFVQTAEPEFPIHLDFFKAATASRERGARSQPVAKRMSAASHSNSEKKLLREVSALRQRVEKLRQSQSEVGAMEKLGIDDARLKSMLTLLHPDKHDGSDAANEAAKWINGLRDLLKSR